MKRFVLLILGVVVLGLLGTQTAHAAVNDFTISDYNVNYDLSRGSDNRSKLTTVETITAVFPAFNQNHGLERAVPTRYQSHNTNLKIQSITDQAGRPLEYSTSTFNNNLIIRIGKKDTYVHGSQTYVLTYTQQDITDNFTNTGRDEFYWDINGTEWRVPITRLSATLHIDPSIKDSLTNNNACYFGFSGSNNACEIAQIDDSNVRIQQEGVAAGENVTIAIGFKSGTFLEYQPSTIERLTKLYIASYLVTIPVSFISVIYMIVRYKRWSNRTKERGAIITEFLPPKELSLTTAAALISNPRAVFTAQLLDYAVRGYIKIYQTKEKGWFRSAEYDIEIIKDITSLKAEEQEILRDIFGSVSVGSRLSMKSLKNNTLIQLEKQLSIFI